MKPTPQESFSRLKSYMPSAGGRHVCSWLCSCEELSDEVSAGFEAAFADSVSVTMFSRSNSDPLISIPSIRLWASPSSAHLGRLRHPPGHRSSSASRNFLNSGLPVQRPRGTAVPVTCLELEATQFSLQSLCRGCPEIETVILS